MKNWLRWVVTVAGCLALVIELCCCSMPIVECLDGVVPADCDPEAWDADLSCCVGLCQTRTETAARCGDFCEDAERADGMGDGYREGVWNSETGCCQCESRAAELLDDGSDRPSVVGRQQDFLDVLAGDT